MVEIPWAFAGPLVKILDKTSILKCPKLLSKMPGIFPGGWNWTPGGKTGPYVLLGLGTPRGRNFCIFQLHSAQLWDRVLG